MVRPPRHESQVTRRKLQRGSGIVEPEPGTALDNGMQSQLGEKEIARTLQSARKGSQGRPAPPEHQAEAVN